jgi:two-component system phosphate regulon sensor histidine kinase PhoR
LIDNAVKYSEAGSSVSVRVRGDAERVIVSVCDTGIGIPEKDIPRIFERFYRVDKARSRELGGTGLGLAIVKHIAIVHGGTVAVESRIGRGSVFTLELPATRVML